MTSRRSWGLIKRCRMAIKAFCTFFIKSYVYKNRIVWFFIRLKSSQCAMPQQAEWLVIFYEKSASLYQRPIFRVTFVAPMPFQAQKWQFCGVIRFFSEMHLRREYRYGSSPVIYGRFSRVDTKKSPAANAAGVKALSSFQFFVLPFVLPFFQARPSRSSQ